MKSNSIMVETLDSGQRVFRNSSGKFMARKQVNRKSGPIRAGSLYAYKGQTVRAREAINRGRRVVSVHDSLFGLVKEKELTPINKRTVNKYLKHAE